MPRDHIKNIISQKSRRAITANRPDPLDLEMRTFVLVLKNISKPTSLTWEIKSMNYYILPQHNFAQNYQSIETKLNEISLSWIMWFKVTFIYILQVIRNRWEFALRKFLTMVIWIKEIILKGNKYQ